MINIDIIAVGRIKRGALMDLWDEYNKRLQWSVTLHEIEGKNPAEEDRKILSKLKSEACLFVMDERGKSLKSREFAAKLDNLSAEGQTHIQFIIGGADGLSKNIREKANFLLSFGTQTWPHMLVRVMLMEQLYRSQQIIAGHPYHRD